MRFWVTAMIFWGKVPARGCHGDVACIVGGDGEEWERLVIQTNPIVCAGCWPHIHGNA